MTNALQGQLAEGVLANLLQYLSLGQAKGCLNLKAAQGASGEIFFSEGRIVHVVHDTHRDVMALSRLLTWETGTFNFVADAPAPAHTVKLSLDSLLLEAAYQADVHKISAFEQLGEDSILLAKPVEQQQQTVAMTLRALHLLRHLDGQRSLGDIAEALNAPFDEVLKAAEELWHQSLVEFSTGPVLSTEFVEELGKLTSDIVGPMAEILIEDVLYDLGYSEQSLPEHVLGDFLERVAVQIKRDDWRDTFNAQVKKLCYKYGY